MLPTITPVKSSKDMKDFILFPPSLYRDDRNFCPHLYAERKKFFSSKNPLFEFTDVAYFLARDENGKLLGRVSAHVNRRHNEYWNEKTGFFGFFECVEDVEVARRLMDAVETWHRERGMERVRGPFNFSTNEECGFLADGFDTPSVIMMPHTKRYYLDFMATLGYAKAKDMYAFYYKYQGTIPEHLGRFSRRALERTGATVRTLDMRRFDEDVARAFTIYNSAWEKNWGFVPMTEAEFRYMAEELKPIIDPALVVIIEKDGVPVAFSLGLPDYNVLLRKTGGRLLPFGWWHLLFGRRTITHVRILTMGVIEPYRKRGLDITLYYETFRHGLPHGYRSCEMSWILEDNVLAIRAIERMGALRYKTYRIFEKKL
jgi:GNAT superfamily N-acetyltransferase